MSTLTNNKTSYELISVSLLSERLENPFELKGIMTDLDIFEHLDKPYLTARLVAVDQVGWYEATDILGGETITVVLSSSKDGSIPVSKLFYITSTEIKQVNSDSQVVIFNLIENIGFVSNLQNVNRHYQNKGSIILEKIASNFLSRVLDKQDDDINNLHAIVPNMDPIEAMKWISNRITSRNGFPFYVYSTLASDKLFLRNLGAMISEPVINPGQPFVNHAANANTINLVPRSRTIIDHRFETAEDLLTLIAKGLVGAKYEFVDSLNENRRTFSFDIKKDLYDVLKQQGAMQGQENPLFAEAYEHDGISFNKYASRKITMFGGSNSHRESVQEPWNIGYREEKSTAGYKKQIISRAMDNVLKKAPLTMVVDGGDFIDGDKHSTIGNNIDIQFTKTSTNKKDAAEDFEDRKRSGNYLIYAARHMFKKERYDISLTCVKLGRKNG